MVCAEPIWERLDSHAKEVQPIGVPADPNSQRSLGDAPTVVSASEDEPVQGGFTHFGWQDAAFRQVHGEACRARTVAGVTSFVQAAAVVNEGKTAGYKDVHAFGRAELHRVPVHPLPVLGTVRPRVGQGEALGACVEHRLKAEFGCDEGVWPDRRLG